nr:fimbrillin family protein [Rikenellaceae bacterium]
MKNLWKTLFVAALFVSCSEANVDEQPVPETTQGQAIEFYADMGGRTSFFEDEGLGVHWVEGDKLAIRRWYGDGNPTAATRQRSTYTALQSGATTAFTWIEEHQYTGDTAISWVENETNHVTAYYPTTANAGAHSITGAVLSDAQVQSEAGNHDHIGDYMMMLAEPQHFAPEALPTKVEFQLTNLFSIVEVTLKGDASKKVESLNLTTASTVPLAFSKGTLNATKSPTNNAFTDLMTISEPLLSVNLSLTTPAALSAEGTKFYFVVLPGKHESGDIVLKATCTDGTFAEVKMGAIEFKMNNVYRPALTLAESDFKEIEVIGDAEIEIVGTNANQYFGSANFEEGSLLIYDRTSYGDYKSTYATWGVSTTDYAYSAENTWQTMVGNTKVYPDNAIKVKTDGYVYLLVRKNVRALLVQHGWELVDQNHITYGTTSNPDTGLFEICRKQFAAGTVLNFATDCFGDEESDDFAGVRPLAKKITWPLAKVVLTETTEMQENGGALAEFTEGARIATSYAQTVSTTWVKNESTKTKSIPAGYVGMKMYTVNRRTKEPYLPSMVVSGTTTSAGWVYQICPEQAWSYLKADGWKRVEYCILTGGNDIDFYIVGKWFESGATVATLDYLEKINEGKAEEEKITQIISQLQYFNTGILLGDLSIAQ